VQVTLVDGTTKDLLQKAYPISNFIAAGFSGSVRIGFMLIQSLRDFLKLPPEEQDQIAWDPLWVSTNWVPIAKSVFDHAPEVERKLGSKLLMVGVSPDQNSGLGAKVYFTRFSYPDFKPGIMCHPIKLCSIGSGAGIKLYKHRIKPLFRFTSGILKAEVGQQDGWARQLGFSISRTLADHPQPGISRHIHIIIIRRGNILIDTNDENIYSADDSRVEIRMPHVAQGYDEFMALAQSVGHDAACAIC
jgi:hypothetical protein